MDYVEDEEGRYYEFVPWHSKQKHEFLRHYLNIWSEMVGNHSKSVPSLDIIDLYASWGQCQCEDKDDKWPGTAVLAAECLNDYARSGLLFLNTYNDDPELMELQRQNLVDILGPYDIKSQITTLPIEEAVDVALDKTNLNFPTLWLLDPYGPLQLPWIVVEKICSAKRSFKDRYGNVRTRRPEVMINLMTSSLQREIHNQNVICNSFGITEDEWKDLEQKSGGGKTTGVIVDAYAERLSQFYEKPPIKFLVQGKHGNIVYSILLFTDSDAGHYVTKVHKMPEFNKWLKVEWKRTAKEIVAKKKAENKLSKDQSSLSRFF